jgi:hypothetical protein
MNEINDDILARIFREYNEAPHSRQKTEVLIQGVKEIFFKLPRYLAEPEKYREKSVIALEELENYLNRFFYQDTDFIERLLYEAKAFILELEST